MKEYVTCNGTEQINNGIKLGNEGKQILDSTKSAAIENSIETLDKVQYVIENSGFIISLILTILTCFIIFLVLNILTNWLTYGKYQGIIIIIFLGIIFGVVFAIFYYGYNHKIITPFIKNSNKLKRYISGEEIQMIEENKFIYEK